MLRVIPFLVCFTLLFSCESERVSRTEPARTVPSTGNAKPPVSVKRQSFDVVRRLPHDVAAFTQGLTVSDGVFIESTGQNGSSTVRRVDMSTGKVLKRISLDQRYFGEGSTVLNGRIYQLTWLNQLGLMYDAETLEQVGTFQYAGEGWGLTTDGTVLYMSNGTSMIAVRDPMDMHMIRSFTVMLEGRPLGDLNELEWIRGELWANVWRTDMLARIDPESGVVTAMVDLTSIFPSNERPPTADVLNGIAFDSVDQAIYVTGKNWPWIYQINVK